MRFLLKFQYYYFFWIILFLSALILRLIGINYGLPYEHNPDERAYFGNVNNYIDQGKIDPGVQPYGYVFFYLVYLTSIITRFLVDSTYIQEYQIIFFRIVVAVISSAAVVIVYEIARRLYKNNFSFLPAAFLAASIGAVTIAHFETPDNIIAFFLAVAVLAGIIYIDSREKKIMLLMAISAAVVVSLKFSYAIFLAYPSFVYLLANNIKFKNHFSLSLLDKKKLFVAIKYIFLTGVAYILVNFFALFHLKTWVGLNYYFFRIYATADYFYFKSLHLNYIESLFTYIKFIFADFYIVTDVSLYISLLLLFFCIYQCIKYYQTDKTKFLTVCLFPWLMLILMAKAVVFQMRNVLPIAPFFLLIIFYPTNITRHIIFKICLLFILFIVIVATFNSMIDVQNHNPEKDLMNFIKKNKGVYAFPNVLYYPNIQYAYYNNTIEKLDLKNHTFFKNNFNKLIFYNQDKHPLLPNAKPKDSAPNPISEISILINKVDYFVIEKQILESIEYRLANKLKLEPTFNQVDIDPNYNIDRLLKKNNFKLIAFFHTSEFETINKYDVAYPGYVQIYIYKHEK